MENGSSIEELWALYFKNRDRQIRNDISLHYMGLVKSIVRRLAYVGGGYVDYDDLNSYGMLGLIKAVERFDPSGGASFETFAIYRIKGEALDYIRRNDWVPRGVRKRAVEYENKVNILADELGKQPTEEEIANRLGITLGELQKLHQDVERFNLISFEELIINSGQVYDDVDDSQTPEGFVQENELMEVLASTIEEMPEREKLIITLYYYEELTLKEISNILGVSESRVSQIHSRAIGRMKNMMQNYIN